MVVSTYRSSAANNILSVIAFLGIFELVSFFVIQVATSRNAIIVGLVLAFIVSPALAVFIQLMRHLKIELTDTEIRFLRMGRPFRVIPFANHHFTSYIHTIRYQYVIPVEYRYLRVLYPDGTTKDHYCSSFSKNTYHRFISEILQLSGQYVKALPSGDVQDLPAANEAPELPFGGAQYSFPKEALRKTLHSEFLRNTILLSFTILLIPAAILTPIVMGIPSMNHTRTIGLFAIISAVVLATIVFSMRLSYAKKISIIPETIRITENSIKIDEQIFHLSQIYRVEMTPLVTFPNPNAVRTLLRKMTITGTEGRKEYLLGHYARIKKCVEFKDYGALVFSINAMLRNAGKAVVFLQQ